jgi:hypothetical protein
VDELDGRLFVIQSDDSNDHGVTWTVSNTHVSTVSDFISEQQQHSPTQASSPLYRNPKMIKASSQPPMGVTTQNKSSKDYDLFMSCLERELALEMTAPQH